MTEPLPTTTTDPPRSTRSDPRPARDLRGAPEDELAMFLEHDQLVFDTRRPVPRAQLSAHARLALWGLRVFAIVVAAMAIYAFAVQVTS
jgi:hypothetical protein